MVSQDCRKIASVCGGRGGAGETVFKMNSPTTTFSESACRRGSLYTQQPTCVHLRPFFRLSLFTVFAQLLRCFELSRSWKGAFAHLYTNRGWLESVGVQALDAGNDFIAVAAVNLLTQLDGV